ncbi:MAG: hypothetical protein KDD70_06220 [Bdellovibrionales bacterium]|nr:hypothetical protein [Bdellovibrionales bacterium]
MISERGEESKIRAAVGEYLEKKFESVLRAVFDERREFWVTALVQLLHEEGFSAPDGEGSNALSGTGDWIQIASLSQLRKEVGGRFQNLRNRWLEAGFPLKAHRGDPSEAYQLDQAGWLEMTSWLLKQGYESRIVEDLSLGYFEIRKPE